MEGRTLLEKLKQEILFARRRIYEVGEATPLQSIQLGEDTELWVKREDLSPIHAYKWRGAYNRMAQLGAGELQRGVVTASAGNHAQGVALAARKLGTKAIIHMPQSTPRMKQLAVKRHGGGAVEIRLVGDTYDAASTAAHKAAEADGLTYIHAYDDLAVMAGQGTLADEIVMSGKGPFDVAFLQVGGGGMAAATATWLKMHYPGITIIGIEGEGQASMAAAVEAGGPVALEKLDIFCDGTAVRKVGGLTHQVCAEVIDEWMTVSNDEVAAAIQFHWEQLRCIPEPSGAMGMAAALKRRESLKGQKALTVLCGGNMDFEQLASVARRAAIGASHRRYLKIRIPEKNGAMQALLHALPDSVNIADFQYGKIHPSQAAPVIGFDLDEIEFEALKKALDEGKYEYAEVTSDTDVNFRMIHYDPKLSPSPFSSRSSFTNVRVRWEIFSGRSARMPTCAISTTSTPASAWGAPCSVSNSRASESTTRLPGISIRRMRIGITKSSERTRWREWYSIRRARARSTPRTCKQILASASGASTQYIARSEKLV